MSVVPGIYQHFKGGLYRVIGTARHTETEEIFVVYENFDGQLWARPEAMFESLVPGTNQPRFTLLRAVRMGRIPIDEMLKAK
jgi:hypothetical protein